MSKGKGRRGNSTKIRKFVDFFRFAEQYELKGRIHITGVDMLKSIDLCVKSLEEQNPANHLRLVISKGTLVVKKKREIGFWSAFRAKLGLGGNASIKNICAFILKNQENILFKHPEWSSYQASYIRFRNMVSVYNKKHVCWKRFSNVITRFHIPLKITTFPEITAQELEQMSMFPEIPLKSESDAAALAALCRKLKMKWLNHPSWTSDQVKELIAYFDKFKLILETFETELGENRIFVNALLQLRVAINEKLVKGLGGKALPDRLHRPDLKNKLKELQAQALKLFFRNQLFLQAELITMLEDSYEELKKNNGFRSSLVLGELKRARKRVIEGGKPTEVAPTYYHVTSSERVIPILNTQIEVKSEGTSYKGAFVSTSPEMLSPNLHENPDKNDYGDWGFALSKQLQQTATWDPITQTTTYPTRSKYELQGNAVFDDQCWDPRDKPFSNKREYIDAQSKQKALRRFWLGFQRGIPLVSYSKRDYPLEYYERSAAINYLFYKKGNVGKSLDYVDARKTLLGELPIQKDPKNPEIEMIWVKAMAASELTPLPDPTTLADEKVFDGFKHQHVYKSFKIVTQDDPEANKPGFMARKLRIVSQIQLKELRDFYDRRIHLVLPTEWKGKIHPAKKD